MRNIILAILISLTTACVDQRSINGVTATTSATASPTPTPSISATTPKASDTPKTASPQVAVASASVVTPHYLYAGCGSGISQFAIGSSTGKLSVIASPVTGSGFSNAILINGNYLYQANKLAQTLSQFSIDPSTGILSKLSTFTVASMASAPDNLLMLNGELVVHDASLSQTRTFTIGGTGQLSYKALSFVSASSFAAIQTSVSINGFTYTIDNSNVASSIVEINQYDNSMNLIASFYASSASCQQLIIQ